MAGKPAKHRKTRDNNTLVKEKGTQLIKEKGTQLIRPISCVPFISVNWTQRVNQPITKKEKDAITRSINRGVPYGSEQWTASTVKRLGLESTTRPRGRPKKSA